MRREDHGTEAKILIVDDEQYVLTYLATVLASEEYSIVTASSGAEALKIVESESLDLVLTDLMMEDMNGLKLLEEIHHRKPGTAVMLITAYGSLRSAVTAMRLGAVDYILKPCDEEELRLRVRNAVEKQVIKKEYARRTRELESVVFAVSHDLSGHLVALKGFARRLRAACQAQLSQEGCEYLDRIDSSSELMEKLILSIDHFARAGRAAKIEKIDLNKVLHDVLENLQSAIEEKDVEIRIVAELPEIEGDWISMYQLFHNLIGNAIKFSREGIRPLIEIGMTTGEKYHKFYVKDNGVGIRREDRETVFEMFGRGDERAKPPGTGMGLAIVRKIISSIHGRIWVESEINVGSTFFFTIPKMPVPAEQTAAKETTSSNHS